MKKSNDFKGKKVLILGLGLNDGGVGSARFFAKSGSQVMVTDLRNEKELKPSLDKLFEFDNIRYRLGQHLVEDIDWADIVIRNQALKPDNEFRIYAQKSGKVLETDVGIFLSQIDPKQIIGVTGTKGKSTTASLVYFAIKNKYPNSVLAGNIGKSVLDSLELINQDTLIILEISSFQLEAFDEHQVSPHLAVITNIMPDHLNYYSSMEEYIQAKRLIAKHQDRSDFLFIKKDDTVVDSVKFLEGLKSKIIRFTPDDLSEEFEFRLPGEHNKFNYAAALKVATQVEVKEDEALSLMNEFSGNEFRLQLIKSIEGIKIYNDSASTMPDSTIEALKSLNNSILIVGGMDKGLDYKKLAEEIDKKVKSVYFIDGTATDKLREHIKHQRILRSTYFDLISLLKDVRLEAKTGDTILFSPGATSFNFWQNEFDRGRKFNQTVEKIFK